jgi:DNA-binding protein
MTPPPRSSAGLEIRCKSSDERGRSECGNHSITQRLPAIASRCTVKTLGRATCRAVSGVPMVRKRDDGRVAADFAQRVLEVLVKAQAGETSSEKDPDVRRVAVGLAFITQG